jgi:hypothetical protein
MIPLFGTDDDLSVSCAGRARAAGTAVDRQINHQQLTTFVNTYKRQDIEKRITDDDDDE